MVARDNSYRICWTVDSWVQALKEANDSPYCGYDFETGPDRRRADCCPYGKGVKQYGISPLRAEDGSRIAGIAVAWWDEATESIKSAYVGIRHDNRHAGGKQPPIKHIIQAFSDFIKNKDPNHALVVHNLMMELSFQLAEGIVWPKVSQMHDTQIAARVLNRGVGWKELVGLKALQQEVLGRNLTSKNDLDVWLKKNRFKSGRDIWRAPVALSGMYAQDDARDTLEIFLKWKDIIYQEPTQWWWHRPPDRKRRKDLYELEIKVAMDAMVACARGTRIDYGFTQRQSKAAVILQDVVRRWVRDYLDMPTVNPGSMVQMRGILFKNRKFDFKVSLAHMTDAFKRLPDRDQAKVVAGTHEKSLIDFASLDVDALSHYEEQYPEHADLMFMLAVYRKCNTAISWFRDRVLEYGNTPIPDPWWNGTKLMNLMFHRLRTVGTISGRMSSADYNGQQVPKRFKMLLAGARLFRILEDFLPPNHMQELFAMLNIGECKDGDEAKVLGLQPGDSVVDFSVRRMFIARPDFNIRLWDLSQVEMRGFAHFSNNKLLCEGYGTPMTEDDVDSELEYIRAVMEEVSVAHIQGVDFERHKRMEDSPFDIHQFVADQLGIGRKSAKGINFGIVYGMGKKKLARGLGWSVDEGKRYLYDYYGRFPEIQTIQTKIKQALRARGYVFDPFGRRYYLPMNKSYVGLNRLIQGWAASAFKVGFARVSDLMESPGFGGGSVDPITGRRSADGMRILTCIHDELMAEVHRDLDTPQLDWAVRSCMTAFYGLKVPLASSSERSHRSWDEAYDVEASLRRSK